MTRRCCLLVLSVALCISACSPHAEDAREQTHSAERAVTAASGDASSEPSPSQTVPDCAEPVVEVTEVRYTNTAYDEAAEAHHSTAPTGFTMRITNASAHAIKPYAYDFSVNLMPSPEVVPTGRAKDWKQPTPFTNFMIGTVFDKPVIEPGEHLDEHTSLSDWNALGVRGGKPTVEPMKVYYDYEDAHWDEVCDATGDND